MNFSKSLKNILVAGSVLIGAASCTDNFEELNTNPNNPSKPTPAQTFTFAQLAVSGVGHETSRLNSLTTGQIGMHYIGAWGDSRVWLTGSGPVWVGEYWNKSYVKIVGNLEVAIKDVTADDADPAKLAMLDVWKVFNAHRITDIYGHVPYFNAGKGYAAAEAGESLTQDMLKPKYDEQSAIYADMISKLDNAVQVLGTAGNSFGEADLVYGGDHLMWQKLANTLRLRLATRLGDDAKVTQSLNAPLIETNEEIALIPFTGEGDIWGLASNGDAFSFDWGGAFPSQAILNAMNQKDTDVTNDDPRLPVFFVNSVEEEDGTVTVYDWFEPQTMQGEDLTTSKHPAFAANRTNIGGYDTPEMVATPMEVAFLRAEHTTDAAMQLQYFTQGINLSLEYYGLGSDVETDYPAFWASVKSNFDANPKAEILKQKWIGLIGNGPEAYAEVRRNSDLFFGTIFVPGVDYKKTSQGTDGGFDDFYQWKIEYPASEAATNLENMQAAQNMPQNFWWTK
ncbi:SusD/RagB family nutrient-binding outer membrane lipoprotein [Flammeovirga sp. MY04]|uniref:SusD/RagB family nutrient-binding outer membrane lipoprotein n=1 Tax=Flammeovirga sp. MY04 TaxID=1191459 RepID=UPI0008062924|nr:SusD/RagB family nutrient-binding outer membrane lipoprotein [Flammeovirga sp. MY04]ANQ50341.1 SusD/RagB family nutrient-binding outer membrane lipoprotein [Flammeovirga sp. MY04]